MGSRLNLVEKEQSTWFVYAPFEDALEVFADLFYVQRSKDRIEMWMPLEIDFIEGEALFSSEEADRSRLANLARTPKNERFPGL